MVFLVFVLMSGCAWFQTQSSDEWLTDGVYLVLIGAKSNPDHLIFEMSRLAGFKGKYWHLEILHIKNGVWYFYGCRSKHGCTVMSFLEISEYAKGFIGDVRRINCSPSCLKPFFDSIEGTPWTYAGDEGTINCTDFPIMLSDSCEDCNIWAPSTPANELLKKPGVAEYLNQAGIKSSRKSIWFPDTFDTLTVGPKVGVINF